MKETTYTITNSIFGEAKDLNAKRDNFRALLKATYDNEELLWENEAAYEAYLEYGRNLRT